jgi:hypothetical protein
MKQNKAISAPVVVALPNTTEKKMEAIAALARATEELAKALNSVNTNVTISDCSFENVATGVSVR